MKDFLLIGNKNCIAHKDFFKLMMDRRVNIGYTRPGDFDQPDGTPLKDPARTDKVVYNPFCK